MLRVKGILWAALSSSTFGLAPLFTLLLLGVGYSSFEVLTYRWGVASLCLGAYGLLAGCDFRLGRRELGTVFLLSLFRAATSLSLVIAYQNIASGVASTIHFMYPLVVAVVMMCFFRERGSVWTFAAIGMSIVGAVLLSLGNVDFSHGDTTLGIVSATVSVVAYGGYIVGVRRSRAVEIDSTVLTCCVMAFGALFFIAGGLLTGGVRLEADPHTWLYILGVAIPATAVSNMALVQAIKSIGPTLTSIFGAHGAADRRGDRRLGFCRAFHGEGRRGHPADRGGGVGRGPAQPERVAGAAGVRRYEKSRSLRSGIFRVLKV